MFTSPTVKHHHYNRFWWSALATWFTILLFTFTRGSAFLVEKEGNENAVFQFYFCISEKKKEQEDNS